MSWALLAGAALAAFVLSWAGTLGLIRALGLGDILDHPNERSSHSVPVPRGGGIAVVATVTGLATLLAAGGLLAVPGLTWVLIATVALAVVGWLDDLHDVHLGARFCVQVAAVAVGVLSFELPGLIFQGLLPPWLDAVAAGLAWLWFVNLFNFMDGIDGLAAGETVTVGIGFALVAAIAGALAGPLPVAVLAATAALGFWWWNAHPARIFLGDVGSIPLGFLLGWLLLHLAAAGAWSAALILPLYYLADATLTLLRRLLRGERVWRAHREHFYQRAVQAGLNHAEVVRAVMAANGALVALAVVSLWRPYVALGAAVAVVAMLLVYLARVRTRR